MATLPVWAFHVVDDPTVGVLGAKKAVQSIHSVGGDKIKATIYPKDKVKLNPHASWSLVFDTLGLLPWLFEQHK